MPTADSQPWRTRLIGLTALAVVVLLIAAGRAAVTRAAAERHRAELLGDLRRLATALDAAYARTGEYPGSIGTGQDALAFTPSPGVALRYERWSADAWTATAETPALTVAPNRCGIWVGDPAAAPHRAVRTPGAPACW